MIVKKRKIPIRILQNNALVNRLIESHPRIPIIQRDTKNRMSGYKGEKELDYYLSLIPSNSFFNFQDLRLPLLGKHFQIDSLITSSSFFTILEVKNFGGIVKYDSQNKQIIQNYQGKITKHQDPILQAERQRTQLQYWLKSQNLKVPPIEILVVMTNPNVIIDFDSINESTERIVYPNNALKTLETYQKKYQTPILSKWELNNLTQIIMEKHAPPPMIDVLKEFNISPDELIFGVQCPSCNSFTIIRKTRIWHCPFCKINSPNAHEKLIIEYLLLFGEITSKQCKDLLKMNNFSKNLMALYLNRMNLPYKGATKNRVYYLPNSLSEFIKY